MHTNSSLTALSVAVPVADPNASNPLHAGDRAEDHIRSNAHSWATRQAAAE
jgi:hypothetical protein